MESRILHIVQKYSNLNWDMLKHEIESKKKDHYDDLEVYTLNTPSTHTAWDDKIVDDLSRIFARLISVELQLRKSSNFVKKHQLFVAGRPGESLHKVDIYSKSKIIFRDINEILIKSDREFETKSNNIYNNQKKRMSQNITCTTSTSNLIKTLGLINIIDNIIKNYGSINKNIVIWSVISESNTSFKISFSHNKESSILLKVLEGLVSICFYQIQKEYIDFVNLKINLVLIIKYSKDLLSLNSEKRPIIVTNQGNNNQIKITCLDSRCLLNYSDIILSQTLNTLTLKLDFSNFNIFEYVNKHSTLNATFFTERSKSLLRFVEKKDTSQKFNQKNEEFLQEISDSEEGEIFDEQENIITLMESEFHSYGLDKLMDVISLKILGKVPIQWNPTASEIFRLSFPVGRNSYKMTSMIYNLVNIGSLLLGNSEVPLCALTYNIPILENFITSRIKENKNMENVLETKDLQINGKLINKLMIRNLCNLAIINRSSILPIPVSRNFRCEFKVNKTCNIEVSEQKEKSICFAVESFRNLFRRIRGSIKLIISMDPEIALKPKLIYNNFEEKNVYFPFRKSLLKIKNNEELSKLIIITFTAIPTLLTDLESRSLKLALNLFEKDEPDYFKWENLENEKVYLKNNFNIKNLKIIDVLFPSVTIGVSRREILGSYIINKSTKTNGKLFQKYFSEKEIIISKLNNFFFNILGEDPTEGCLLKFSPIGDDQLKFILENRNFVKQNIPKIIWLSLNFLINSLKFISREHQRIFYIIYSGKNFEFSNNIVLPLSQKSLNIELQSFDVFNNYLHLKNTYFDCKNISYSQVKRINTDSRNVNYKRLNCE